MLDIPTPYPVTPEWLSKAKLFLSEKWKERAKELKRPEPTDLSGACKFASLFGKEIFGLDIQGNWGHQFNVTLDGKPLDLLGGQTGDVNYLHDKKFFGNPEHSKSIESCKPRVMRWVEEFRQRYPLVSKIAASQRWSHPLLNGLKAEARKAPTFEDFKHDFSLDIKHGLYFHVTDNPNFTIDPAKGPRDMSSMGGGTPTPGKLMVTSHLENWTDYYESDRAYVAIIDMSEVPREAYHQVSRGFGNEFWVESPQNAKVSAVMPVKEAIKLDRTYQNVMDLHSDEDLLEFYNQFHDPVTSEWKPPKEQGKLPFRGKGIAVASTIAPPKQAAVPTGNAVDDLGISGQQGWSYDEPFPDRGNDFYEDDQIQNPHSERPLTAALSPVYTEEVKKLEYEHELISLAEEMGNFERVVWERQPVLKTHTLDTVGLAGSAKDYPHLRAVHVGDPDYWFNRLAEDFGRESKAWVVEIYPTEDDYLCDDVQYSMDPSGGDKAYSAILITPRTQLVEGKDFRYVKELTEEDLPEVFEEEGYGWEKDAATKKAVVMWVRYQGKIHTTVQVGGKSHAQWLEELSLPFSGPSYDRIERGVALVDRGHRVVHLVKNAGGYTPNDVVEYIKNKYDLEEFTFVDTESPDTNLVASKQATSEDDYYNAAESFFEREEIVATEVINEYIQHVRQKKYRQQWNVVPAARLIKIWEDYMKTGFVRDSAGLSQIAETIIDNALKIYINSILCGHSPMHPEEYAADIMERNGITKKFPENYFERAPDFFDTPAGGWRLSDQSERLINLAQGVFLAKSDEDKLQALDKVLQFSHPRSDLSSWLVQGGRTTLNRLFTGMNEYERWEQYGGVEEAKEFNKSGNTLLIPKTAARRPKYPTYVPDTRTFSEAFKKWFEGSKVVDAYGKPLLVYHGSPDTRFLKEEGVFQTPTERFLHKEDPERAFWFAADYSTASSYADPHRAWDYQGCEPGTKGFYLSIKNPYMVNKGGQSWHGTDTTIADAKAGGHDGIIIHNTVDTYQAKGLKTDTYAVFSPNQIKAADNIICDPISPNVNASKTAAQRRAFFHGTSIRNLRSILKQGLIPNPKERNWADDPDAGIRPSRESYGGVYVTTSLMTAISSPKDHNKEGREVVVCLSLQPSTFYLDEDDINFYVNEPFPSLSDSTNSFYALSTYLAMTLPNGSRWKEFGEGERQKYIDEVIRGLKFKWGHTEGEKTVMHPRLEEHLRSLLPAMWLASLARIASYIVFGPKRSDFDKREYDVAKAYLEVFPKTEWEAVPPMGKLFPSRQEGEGMYKEESERLTRALRLYARPHYEGGYRNTARVDTPIGYSGSNRITAVVEVRDGRQYLDDQPRDAEGSQTVEMVLHYGTALPQEFLTQWKERYGYKYTVTRSTESGKTAAEGFDPDYYMTEGCGIFAVALARLNKGVVYFMSDPEGDPWHNIGEMSPQQIEELEDSGSLVDWNMTHVYCMAPDGKTYDIKGQRSPAVMAKDFDMDPADPEVSLDGGPYQPDDFMNQFMGEMPESGEGERPLYGNEADVVEVTQYILKNPRKYGLTRKGR